MLGVCESGVCGESGGQGENGGVSEEEVNHPLLVAVAAGKELLVFALKVMVASRELKVMEAAKVAIMAKGVEQGVGVAMAVVIEVLMVDVEVAEGVVVVVDVEAAVEGVKQGW